MDPEKQRRTGTELIKLGMAITLTVWSLFVTAVVVFLVWALLSDAPHAADTSYEKHPSRIEQADKQARTEEWCLQHPENSAIRCIGISSE